MEEYYSQEKFIILDGHAIIYRAYHALKELTDPMGKPINAVFGFARILLKVINDYDPKYIAVTFDHKNGKSTRVAEYKDYKGQRPPMPDDLIPQIQIIKDLVDAFNIPKFELDGFEADDLLGTISKIMDAKNELQEDISDKILTIIVTGDKDMLQLVNDNSTHVFIPGNKWSRDIEYVEAQVIKKLGVRADQVPDLKALMGDPSDNIPGVKGVGVKTASKLIQEFETLEKLYETVDVLAKEAEAGVKSSHSVIKGATLTKLTLDKEMAYLSQKLATINREAPVDFKLEACVTKDYDKAKVAELFEHYKFNSLKNMLPKDGFEESIQEALF
jgi:DNA polymerase-1